MKEETSLLSPVSTNPPVPVSRPGLIRALGPWMATAVVVGSIIGSGVFKKPQAVAESTPFFGEAILVWVLGGILTLLGGLALAEVAVLFPRAGGNYVFLREGYGRLAGFLYGWVELWIVRCGSLAALATIFTESFHDLLRQLAGSGPGGDVLGYWDQKFLTVGVILALALVNVRGVRWGGVLQLLITLVKVGSLAAIIVLPGLALLGVLGPTAAPPKGANLTPVWPAAGGFQLGAFMTSFLAVSWAYHGWMDIAPVAEEVRSPQRNIPLSLLGGIGIVLALYVGANVAYALVIPQAEMTRMKETPPESKGEAAAPAAEHAEQTVATGFCRRLLGPIGVALAAAAIMFSVFGAMNGNLLVGPRVLYAMGEDGLAPRVLGEVHARFRTPAPAILVLAGWSSLLILGVALLTRLDLLPRGKSHFDVLTDFAMFGAIIFETLAVATIFVFRRRLPDADRPYRCWGYPVVPILYVVLPVLVLGNMFVAQQTEALVGVGFIALGTVVFFLTVGRRPAAPPARPGEPLTT